MISLYNVLIFERIANDVFTQDERKQYKQDTFQFHPDRGGNEEEFKRMMNDWENESSRRERAATTGNRFWESPGHQNFRTQQQSRQQQGTQQQSRQQQSSSSKKIFSFAKEVADRTKQVYSTKVRPAMEREWSNYKARRAEDKNVQRSNIEYFRDRAQAGRTPR